MALPALHLAVGPPAPVPEPAPTADFVDFFGVVPSDLMKLAQEWSYQLFTDYGTGPY